MQPRAGRTVVTLSAAYGAGGSEVGPKLADTLGVPFVDRAIPAQVAEQMAVPLQEAMTREESEPSVLDRLLRSLAAVGPLSGADVRLVLGDRTFAEATEQAILRHAETTGGVILGRAGAFVLRDHPGALHVRLTGPRERRLEQAMRIQGLDRRAAERRMADSDAARDAYVHAFYGGHADDPQHYHLVIDSTALPLDDVVALIAQAVAARSRAAPAPA